MSFITYIMNSSLKTGLQEKHLWLGSLCYDHCRIILFWYRCSGSSLEVLSFMLWMEKKT